MACQAAKVRFETEVTCIDNPDPDACRARALENPCFQDPASDACRDFLDPVLLRTCFDPDDFTCQILASATSLYCTSSQETFASDEVRCGAGGGTEEESAPSSRGGSPLASAGAGGGGSVLVGLTDPGGRGDAGISAEARRPRARAPLASTGLALPGLFALGLVMLSGGALLRRGARAQ
jgi:hypothetical protein